MSGTESTRTEFRVEYLAPGNREWVTLSPYGTAAEAVERFDRLQSEPQPRKRRERRRYRVAETVVRTTVTVLRESD